MTQLSSGTETADDTRLLNVLIELQVGIRKISMYGLSHSIVPKIVGSLSEKFNTILSTTDSLPLVIAKDEILYQEHAIGPGNATISELSQSLHHLNLIHITFKKGLTEDALLKFLTFILAYRAKTVSQHDPIIAQFHQEAPNIVLQWVTFKEAIKHQGAAHEEGRTGNIWQNLLRRSTNPVLPEEVHRLIHADPGSTPDTETVAAAINALYAAAGLEKGNYEPTVLDFLKNQHSSVSPEGPQGYTAQNLGLLFSKLRADVREQVFRLSMRTQENHVMPIEDFLEHIPANLLPEVLNQIDLSETRIAPPTFRLLKKMATLAEKDGQIKAQLANRLQNCDTLRNELIPGGTKNKDSDTASRIQDFSKKLTYTEDKAFSDTETDAHTACVLLEILEQPMFSEAHLAQSVTMLCNILNQDTKETLSLLIKTIQTLIKNARRDSETEKIFWQAQLKHLLSPEIVLKLLKAPLEWEERTDNVVDDLVSTAGADLFHTVFHILEVAPHLSTRKQAIRFLIGCGPAVVPFAVAQLKNPKWFVVRNMLVILKDLKATDEVLHIIPCMKHQAEQVRLAGLQTLDTLIPETDLFLNTLGTALHDPDESVSKTAITMLVSSRQAKASDIVSALFLEAEQNRRLIRCQHALLKELAKSGTPIWLPTLLNFKKGLLFWLTHWGQQRVIQHEIRKAFSEIKARGGKHA